MMTIMYMRCAIDTVPVAMLYCVVTVSPFDVTFVDAFLCLEFLRYLTRIQTMFISSR